MLVEGARIKGKVTGVERYGIFVQVAGTQGRSGRGLVPTPETGTPRGADSKKHFSVGQDVEAKILNIDADGKIRLSIAALGADEERGLFEAFKSGQSAPPSRVRRRRRTRPRAHPEEGEAGAAQLRHARRPAPQGHRGRRAEGREACCASAAVAERRPRPQASGSGKR